MHIWACNEVDTLLSLVVLSGKLVVYLTEL